MKAIHAAALARAEAVWNATQVHEIGGVPASPVTPYLALSVTGPGPGGSARSGGSNGGAAVHRTVVQAVGRTAGEVAFAVEKATAAFVGHRLVVAGKRTTAPRDAEVASPVIRDPDAGGLLTCTLTFPFAVTPA